MPLHLLSKTTKSFSREAIAATRFFERSASVRAVLLLFAVELLLLISPDLSRAQSIQYTDNKPDQTLRSTMRVDPSTLGLSIEVPIANYPGRGGLSMPISLSYSSKQWRIDFEESWMSNGGLLRTESIPMFSEWAKAGWTTSADIPVIDWTGAGQQFNYDGTPFCGCGDEGGYYIKRIQVHMPGGSSLELRIDDTPTTSQFTFGTYYAVDGSNLRYEASSYTDGVLYLPDGSRYVLTSSSAQYIDRNGNTLSYSATSRQWTDTQGRVLDVPLAATPSAITYTYNIPSTTSTPASYSVRWSTLQNALTNPSDELHYKTNMTFGIGETWNPRSPALFIGDGENRLYDGPGFPASEKFNPLVLAEIILPNGQHYLFTYNVFGELTKVVYPTGAYERFNYAAVAGVSFLKQPYIQANRGVVDRWLSPTGNSTDEVHWHYAAVAPETALTLTVSTTAPDNTVTERLMRAETSEIHENHNLFGFSNVQLGMTFEERVFAPPSAGGAMLMRTLTSYTSSGPTPGGWSLATRNPRAVKTVNIMLDTGTGNALTSTTTKSYDDDLNVIATNQYDFTSISQSSAQTLAIESISAGSLLRTDEATYLVNDTTIDSNTRTAYRNRNLLRLPTSLRMKNSNGNIVAQSSLGYDETSLQTFGNPNGWIDPQTPYRGNPTRTGSWLNTTNTFVNTQTTYDQFGNVRSTTDAKGNQSQIEYSAAYGYAYPTLTTSADPDGAGPLTSLTTETEYNANTGLMTSLKDANGKTTSYTYDAINRPATITRPIGGGSTSYAYGDVPGDLYVRTQTSLDSTRVLEAYEYYDKLGRPSRAFLNEGSTYLTTDVQYDLMGRSWRKSNPYRTTSLNAAINPDNHWTTNAYDYLGRVTSVTTSDGAVVTSAYSGSTSTPLGPMVTVTDQAGRLRRSLTDALGRLSRVDEPDKITGALDDGNGAPIQATNYTYDLLGNLLLVTQGSQTRTFAYNSLSQITSANNPESGAICYGTVNAGQCQADGYDANGNLVYKTDARGVRTTFVYDNLNRVTSLNYSDGTPTVTNVYDSGTISNGKGRLAAVSSSVSAYSYSGYDAMGRALGATQMIGAQSYLIGYTYDLAGHVETMTYPSGHSVTYNYNRAGRLADKDAQNLAFTGNLGEGGSPRTYASGLSYSSFGGLQEEKFGTQTPIYHKLRYNVRGQLWDVRASTVSFATDPGNGDRGAIVNYYSSNFVQGGSGTDNNGNLLRQENYIPGSNFFQDNFAYDKLNRLTAISEKLNGTGNDTFKQTYFYDRNGNRRIDTNPSETFGGVNNLNFDLETATNRLYAQGDLALPESSRGMRYDAAGNLWKDTYSGAAVGQQAIERLYDAENRIIKETQSGNYVAGEYSYDGDGRRVKRKVGSVETWQVYGVGGELLAEYAQNGAAANPLKEYGYRDGQLLIATDTGTTSAAAPSGLAATPPVSGTSITLNWTAASGATNYRVERQGAGGSYGLVGTTTNTTLTDNTTISGSAYLYKVCAANGSGNCTSGFSNIALGAAVTFLTDPTIKSYSEDPANATSPKAAHINELRAAVNAVRDLAGWPAIAVPNPAVGNLISVNDVRDLRTKLGEALTTLGIQLPTYTDATLKGFLEDPSNATTIKAAHIRELRQAATHGLGGSGGGGGSSFQIIRWLVNDHLGTPRMIFDQTGSLANVSRHDYLPFGEEVPSNLRAGVPGYPASDNVRQKFTQYERDTESGLDFAQARYYASVQGRFTSVDPLQDSAKPAVPQSWNRYSYVMNNPLVYIDPTGELWIASGDIGNPYSWVDVCPEGATCYETVAASVTADDNRTYAVVYGAANASDITAYSPNEHGMIDLSMVAANPSAEFILRDGTRTVERFASVETAVGLYNATEYYSRLYPDDAEIMVTNSSLADGTGSAAHPRSHGRPNSAIDFRYLDENGRRLQGGAAAANADAGRMTDLFDAFEASGFNQSVSGRPRDFGTGPINVNTDRGRQLIRQHQNHGHVGIVPRLRRRR
jgi:RHS repeat-associated protein